MAYFNCFCKIRFFFFKAFKAYKLPVAMCFAKNTLPKAPLPNVDKMSKLEKLTLLFAI